MFFSFESCSLRGNPKNKILLFQRAHYISFHHAPKLLFQRALSWNPGIGLQVYIQSLKVILPECSCVDFNI